MDFYTNVSRQGANILHRGIRDGRRFSEKVKYRPYIFLPSKHPNTKYQTIYGDNVEPLYFNDMWEETNWRNEHRNVSGFKFYGSTNRITTFIYDTYPNQMKFDQSLINVAIFDIECGEMITGDDFVETAPAPITTISLFVNNQKYAFGLKPFDVPKGVKYFHCTSEEAMLDAFLEVWENADIDVAVGWNNIMFDVPYLINRINRVLKSGEAERLSPWKKLFARKAIDKFGREKQTYDIIGISVIDYQELYKKFTVQVHGQLESYSLGYVSYFELDESKVDYSEFSNLVELYEKDFQKYMEYNIHDCELIVRLDAKMRFLELLFEIAYIAKCNYQEVMKTIPVWESLIHSYLMDRRIVVPSSKPHGFAQSIPGGFVKEPIPNLYKWVVSFDVASLYPHLIMQYNLSPETLKGKKRIPDIQDLLAGADFDHEGYSVAATGCYYSKYKSGFLPVLMKEIFDRRNVFKKQMLAAQDEYEHNPTDEGKKAVASLKAKQQAYKILANSGYGALANQYFTFFSYDLAMSITLSGQLSIKWVASALNDYMNTLMKTKNVDYIIAVDTDSNYLNCGPLIAKLFPNETDKNKIVDFLDKFSEQKCQAVIDRAFDELAQKMNAYDPCLKMKREAIAESALWTGKKRYAMNVMDNEGVRYEKPKIKITGMESKRSSVPEIVRDALSDCIEIMLTKDEDTLEKFVHDFKEKFFASSFYDIASPRGCNGVSKYYDPVNRFAKKCPFHVKGAIVYNEWIEQNGMRNKYQKINDGDKIKYIYIKYPNELRSEVISCLNKVPDELEIEKMIDYNTQYQKTFMEPLNAMLKVAKWAIDREHTLEDAF